MESEGGGGKDGERVREKKGSEKIKEREEGRGKGRETRK